jgi:hypothetical protein
MNYRVAQQELAASIMSVSAKVNFYFWRLSGDEPNSLCKLLGMEEEKLKSVLRVCKIYIGDLDNFSKNNFESVMGICKCDHTTYRPQGKVERFILVGMQGEVVLPKDMYDQDGKLMLYPVEDEHIKIVRTKSQRGALPTIAELGEKNKAAMDAAATKDRSESKQGKTVMSPKAVMLTYIQELVKEAAQSGSLSISPRANRKLQRMMFACVDVAAKDMLFVALEKYAMGTPEKYNNDGQLLMSPEKAMSSSAVAVVSPPTEVDSLIGNDVSLGTGETIEVDSDDDLVDDLTIATTTTTTSVDEFLSEMKEDLVLQTLLHKRIHEKKERVFQMEHRNGRRLLVVLPPDTRSIASFVEEATKTQWVDIMLNSDERVEGMLTHLAKHYGDKYTRIGQKRDLSMKTIALDTAQTIALARVGRLNDVRMKKIKSFLRQVGNVNLQLSAIEVQRIDIQVGWHRTKEATYGSHLHEWSLTKGKEKKPPELVHYWNSSLKHEIEAEVDLYLQHLYLEKKSTNSSYQSPPLIDYAASGFNKPGVTVLFGGDHGDQHCPISCKINMSSPQERKKRGLLSYQCPVITFASVKCSTDSYGLMDSTVMPLIKQQLTELKGSSVIVVYSSKNMTGCFRSYMVPSTIRPGTVGFVTPDPDVPESPVTMTFSYGEGVESAFGSLVLNDPVFSGIPFFHLRSKVVISTFNELFIGDLAFLAMLIGMNKSSGAHCLMCMLKGSEFNCPLHTVLPRRTKEALVECLEQYMLLASHPTRKAPPNYKGVNGPGLWDIDPQRIIIPILHCPMGLVDKILESFKHWVNLEVEDFKDGETEAARGVYVFAKHQHATAILAYEQAKELARNAPLCAVAKAMERAANKARIAASKEETKAKEVYSERVQCHNAKKTSLNQQFEIVYRNNGVKREHYHGGKFNGVNCIRIMSMSKEILCGDDTSTGFLQCCLLSKIEAIPEAVVQSTCENYCRLLGLLDAIWSTVRGLHAGLLPTDPQKQSLQKALDEAKTMWIQMKLSTLQPKWHLTFDGHLLEQFTTYDGLADKSDETIEKGHQTLKVLRDRFRGVSSYEMTEACIRRELRRGRSPEIQQHIDKYEASIKQSLGTKRALDTVERLDNKKKAKQEKRDAFIGS